MKIMSTEIKKPKKKNNRAFYLACERKEEGKKKKTITGDNPTTIRCHTSHHVKESTIVYPKR
jgi:hypothetical protein